MISYKLLNNTLYLKYIGQLSDVANNIYLYYGYGSNWNSNQKVKMEKKEDCFFAEIKIEDEEYFNYCFCDDNNNWDNNNQKNYTINIKQENLVDNATLLISEVKNKIVFPYTAGEIYLKVEDINNNYNTKEEVIEEVYTRRFDEYKFQYSSRFKEAIKLIVEREKMSLIDGINLGIELFKKRYLHPAIIAACKNLDELNVYIDCLDKNELDDYPVVANDEENHLIKKIKENYKRFLNLRHTTE